MYSRLCFKKFRKRTYQTDSQRNTLSVTRDFVMYRVLMCLSAK
nr:MAG TPA: hypothetical protein [Caudoviricetes sp.]